MLMDSPIYDQIASELGSEPDRPTPCICHSAPDECVLHPRVRFTPAPDAVWPGDDEHPAAVGHA